MTSDMKTATCLRPRRKVISQFAYITHEGV